MPGNLGYPVSLVTDSLQTFQLEPIRGHWRPTNHKLTTRKNLVDTRERMRNYFDHDSGRREDNGKRIIREDRRFCWPLILYN